MKSHTVLVALLAVACGGETSQLQPAAAEGATSEMSAEHRAALDAIEAATLKYAEASAALADGFLRDPGGRCVTAEEVGAPAELGAMGVHYIHPARLGLNPEAVPVDGSDPVIDWTQPEVLVYEPQADGSEKLVAVEYLVFKAAWDGAGNAAPPNFFGIPFIRMIDDPNTEIDEAHEFMPHYELHIWSGRDNPNGRFAEFNPAVTCAHLAGHAH